MIESAEADIYQEEADLYQDIVEVCTPNQMNLVNYALGKGWRVLKILGTARWVMGRTSSGTPLKELITGARKAGYKVNDDEVNDG